MAGHIARLICAVALLMHVLLPAGLMPVRASDNAGYSVVICTGTGPLTVNVGADGKRVPDNGQNQKRCDFASSGAAAACDDQPVTLASPAIYAIFESAARREAVRKTALVTKIFVRGPPAALI